ncbi:hypothetical protein Tco_0320582 [Tanacetum coccineum]
MYLTSSRPDIVQAICYCACYQARPTQKHLKEVKRIFKYIKGTINIGLWYLKDSGFELAAFLDADHAGCIDTRKSTSGGIQFLSDKLVSWMSKKQNCTAMYSAEAEYMALYASCAQSAIAYHATPYNIRGTKHIHTRYHFIKEQVENGIIELYFVGTEYQLADMFTKALPEDRFKYLVRRISMRCLTSADLEMEILLESSIPNKTLESSTTRPTGGRGVDYGFVSTLSAEERRRGIRDIGYGIRDTWVDPSEAVPEIAPMTVGEVNTRVTELAELHEHDTQDLYALLEDAQDSRTHISQ